MKTFKLIAACVLGAAVSGCASMPDMASRNAPFEAVPPSVVADPVVAPINVVARDELLRSSPLRVAEIDIRVPRSLKVSEANLYYPRGDIVWRGDQGRDRHAQVKRIFEQSFKAGTAALNGGTDVRIEVEVTRFHSLSEKARYTIGGVHNIEFDLTIRRLSTGQPLAPTKAVEANLEALGGRHAVQADAEGQTQKVRVMKFLEDVIQDELSLFVAG